MDFSSLFFHLPYGFSSFDNIKDNLIDCRAKGRLPLNAVTVISVLFPYYLGEDAYRDANVSRYAVSADYHMITKAYLDKMVERLKAAFPENRFEAFTDNSPLPEVKCAVNAGLGVLGRNNLFINPVYGSWVFLSEIVTDKYFEPFSGTFDLCIGCNRCVESCPVGALTGKGLEREKCLSFLSQKKGELPEYVKRKMAEYHCVWGCDVCQKVCPLNQNAEITPIPEFIETARPHITADDSVEGRAFAWRGKEVIERNIKAVGGAPNGSLEPVAGSE